MTDQDRAIGRLEGKMDGLMEAVSELQKDVKQLTAWKWRVVGGAAFTTALVSVLFKLVG